MYLSSFFVFVLRAGIWVYRHSLSYFMGRHCRFEPSCSVYAEEALRRYGLKTGGVLALRRLMRCGPCGGSGFDPVPDLALPKKIN